MHVRLLGPTLRLAGRLRLVVAQISSLSLVYHDVRGRTMLLELRARSVGL